MRTTFTFILIKIYVHSVFLRGYLIVCEQFL